MWYNIGANLQTKVFIFVCETFVFKKETRQVAGYYLFFRFDFIIYNDRNKYNVGGIIKNQGPVPFWDYVYNGENFT